VGRIETVRTWPDLATMSRIAHALELHVTLGGGVTGPADVTLPAARPAETVGGPGAGSAGRPLEVGLPVGDATTSAQVIEVLLAHSPRLAAEVTRLAQRRRAVRAGRAAGRP
jgi:hypothetical protein